MTERREEALLLGEALCSLRTRVLWAMPALGGC
jgi:hypothetical protein